VTRAKISEYSATANDNTDVNGINIAEGCPPSSMNNMGREIMAALKRFQVGSDGDGVTVGGSLVVSGSTSVNTFNVDVISEKTSAAGVTVDGVLLKDSQVSTDQINEKTSATGVTVDGVLLKDSGVVTGAGTVSAPVYSTTGDLNTGIFFPAADTIAFAEGGAEAMRINSSGNVGIGTSSPGTLGLSVAKTSGTSVGLQLYQTSTETFRLATDNSAVYFQAIANIPLQVYTNNTERARITSAGQLFINKTTNSADGKLEITGNASNTNIFSSQNTASSVDHVIFSNSNGTVGTIKTSASATSFNTSSDYRLKENVAPMTGALAKVLELNPVTYTWRVDGSTGEGFIAHELQAVCPDAVTGEKDATEIRQVEVSPAVPATYDEEGNELTPAIEAVYEQREVPVYQGVDTSFLVATLTAAIQELKAINDAQASRIETLEAKVAALEAR
jgi:hypothetical protein